MFQLTIALLLFLLVALRFVRRVRQEGRRQRALTWPRATAVLTGQHDSLAVTAKTHLGVPIFYAARLEQPYTFYARGERHTGDRLAPELERLNPAEAKTFLQRLATHRRYEICYDPNDPENNYLTVGKDLLGNRHLLLYAILGVQLPLFLGFLYVADGAAFTPQLVQTFTWVFVGSVFLFLAFYFRSSRV